MSSSEIVVKRLRRQWEPTEKAWNDDALQLPWEDVTPALHKTVVFALKNVFFFSHATSVQSQTIHVFSASGSSVLVEAPTGSGKTLAVLIPLMQRTIQACEAYVAEHSRPLLRRDIIGVILSPSRVLAEQTFVVGRNLASRLTHAIRFALCDGALHSATTVLDELKSTARGAGTFLVTTPHDLADFVAAWEAERAEAVSSLVDSSTRDEMQQLLAAQDDETRRRYYAKHGGVDAAAGGDTGHTVQLRGCNGGRFVLVVDEADLVFDSPGMREVVTDFVATYACMQGPLNKRRKGDSATPSSAPGMAMDVAFVGATVSTSQELWEYATHVGEQLRSEVHKVVLNSTDDFVTQLQNRYVICEAHEFIPLLIQLMNIHASRKHFIFFNSSKTLRFIEKLFALISEGEHPLLFIKSVFVMYEGMSERARLEQYNAFLNHKTDAPKRESGQNQRSKRTDLSCSAAEKKNQVYSSGWKRDGRQPDGRGAILLCTDVAAFGLDVRDVDYVYHFEPPTTVQSYVHRIGRVGRMGMRGSSILILPCFSTAPSLMATKERKTSGVRFNTLTNTKHSTAELQVSRVSDEDLSDERRRYLKELGERSELQSYSVPPFAPIAPTIRNVISQHKKLTAMAKTAAISACTPPCDVDCSTSWFDPKLALHAFLLD